MKKSFEELLFDGAMTAMRSLTLEELYEQAGVLEKMNMTDDIAEFPRIVLALAIAEKQRERALN
ncbi:MAG: hypothetical protein JWP25_4701 [Bradyrhizobium sp.]|nr:hypothetical protein [Bradyrhizobium sp.]